MYVPLEQLLKVPTTQVVARDVIYGVGRNRVSIGRVQGQQAELTPRGKKLLKSLQTPKKDGELETPPDLTKMDKDALAEYAKEKHNVVLDRRRPLRTLRDQVQSLDDAE